MISGFNGVASAVVECAIALLQASDARCHRFLTGIQANGAAVNGPEVRREPELNRNFIGEALKVD